MKKSSLERLRISNFKLEILLEITRAINENLSTGILIQRYEQILRTELNIGKVLIFNFKQKWECLLCSGMDLDLITKIDVNRDLIDISEIQIVTRSEQDCFKSIDIIIPVFHKEKPLAYVLIGDIDEEQEGMSPSIKHLHFIQTLTNIIIVAIENKRLYKESLKQEALKKELELASKMQEMLIPSTESLPNNDKLYVHGFYLPHYEVGGDYYDFIELNENEAGFCIADVSGKGISAAILMSNFQANLRALFTPEISLIDLIRKLNEIVLRNTKGERFITIFIAKYNYNTKELVYINAGHNPPILYNTKNANIYYLKNGCVGLGMIDDIPEINKGFIKVAKHTKLLCYTDGLVEVENDNDEAFGLEHAEKIIPKDEPINMIINELIENLNVFRGSKPLFDDISILGLEFF
ncbi:MAG: hypothetical protein A2W98_10025 [Bacteroidetes bacterium GWF2_33_38]|nr:MAG: hypothetical protein A2W98_10025 [Bacteroidetes bacterium GWF2_33_38]OFY74552.1 MAG: hypothetical protein A2265_04620 [Bacteroidetes bacterium RIFOXYA12_FULL_33_9]OFY91617.1 MAG: hypothetical protein A2236_11500 [Bacteroidetes bacterium RIFOXYA2_FULL_33_7]HBX52577.1 serine/threonine protein phosphatase [Bacteroidales bacterium]